MNCSEVEWMNYADKLIAKNAQLMDEKLEQYKKLLAVRYKLREMCRRYAQYRRTFGRLSWVK